MNETSQQLLFVRADRVPGIKSRIHDLVPWIYGSDRRYFEILLAGYPQGETLTRWMKRGDGEIDLSRTHLAIADDEIAGGFVAMRGAEVATRREADILDLVRHTRELDRGRLRPRIQDLFPLFGPVKSTDFYVSKFGLLPGAARIRPHLGEPILEYCVEVAKNSGASRIRIDVDQTDRFVSDLCDESGFREIRKGRADRARITYRNLESRAVN